MHIVTPRILLQGLDLRNLVNHICRHLQRQVKCEICNKLKTFPKELLILKTDISKSNYFIISSPCLFLK